MMIIIGVLITLTVSVSIVRLWVRARANATNLGWMSQQWLAEHRASHLS